MGRGKGARAKLGARALRATSVYDPEGTLSRRSMDSLTEQKSWAKN